jgi:hypothetical protein
VLVSLIVSPTTTPTAVSKDSNNLNGITLWAGMSGKGNFPTLFKYVLDTLSYPAMSTECERAKKLITPEQNQLGDIIKAYECLKAS